jgi:hypothetical protein
VIGQEFEGGRQNFSQWLEYLAIPGTAGSSRNQLGGYHTRGDSGFPLSKVRRDRRDYSLGMMRSGSCPESMGAMVRPLDGVRPKGGFCDR